LEKILTKIDSLTSDINQQIIKTTKFRDIKAAYDAIQYQITKISTATPTLMDKCKKWLKHPNTTAGSPYSQKENDIVNDEKGSKINAPVLQEKSIDEASAIEKVIHEFAQLKSYVSSMKLEMAEHRHVNYES